jgi:hypothetical protein
MLPPISVLSVYTEITECPAFIMMDRDVDLVRFLTMEGWSCSSLSTAINLPAIREKQLDGIVE